jgi:hypothetical protein
MRADLRGDFRIDVVGRRLNVGRHWHDVADFFQEASVCGQIAYRPRVCAVPVVEFALQTISLGRQRAVLCC